MNKLVALVLTLCVAITGCTKPYKISGNDVNLGKDVRVEVVVSFKHYRSKTQKITSPYYQKCLNAYKEVIVDEIEAVYNPIIKDAVKSAGYNLTTTGEDSSLTMHLLVFGNGDFGSLLFYSDFVAESKDGSIRPNSVMNQGYFNVLEGMPWGLDKTQRNDYCESVWEQKRRTLLVRLDDFMQQVSEYHVDSLVKAGLLQL